ncbi:unnamed protein product [Danaus chrysippus]|uniref:(African queen) hypothetical protein n=1 Tax=Danaus chrysippus TaxID=151541 RepID=A0A8J2QT96_9NEOP|nr:unnamed protein product [Danaus chrysippus]
MIPEPTSPLQNIKEETTQIKAYEAYNILSSIVLSQSTGTVENTGAANWMELNDEQIKRILIEYAYRGSDIAYIMD